VKNIFNNFDDFLEIIIILGLMISNKEKDNLWVLHNEQFDDTLT
jgi:hypothetical protein